MSVRRRAFCLLLFAAAWPAALVRAALLADAPVHLPPLPPGLSPLSLDPGEQPESAGHRDLGDPAATAAGDGTPAADPDAGAASSPAERVADGATGGLAPAPALEGPPVPLPREPRLSGAAHDGIDDDRHDRPITMHVVDAALTEVLAAFARFTGLNIVASERVQGNVTLHLNAVPWRTAFDTLLDVQGLAMAQRENVIWVAPLAELAARERQRFEAHARASELEPLESRTFALRYPRAEDVQRLLSAPGAQRVLSKRGGAMADPRTNLLFVTDLAGRLAQVAELIAAIDRPTRQVLIEARIVEGVRGFSQELGARLSMQASATDGPARGLVAGADARVYDFAARAAAGFEAATAGLTLFAAGATRLVTAELSALETQGRGHIVSSPRVVTADRTTAIVEQGTELPYQAKVRNGVSGVQFRRASLRLEVEPQITPHGRVVLDLDIAKDSVGEPTAAGPAIDTKHVRTRVEVEDGGTVAIGGIYERHDRHDVTGVPLLGKIPLIGALFRHRARHERESELMVLITPRVVEID
jgi:type IV pilus assembly protein PilQ